MVASYDNRDMLTSADLQLTSLQNEHHKKQEEISELKKARDTAVYNVSQVMGRV